MLRSYPARQAGSLELVTGPAAEPVTKDEVKLQGKIDSAAEDALIDAYITAARQLIERLTGRALITQSWTLTLDDWPRSGRDDWWDGQREAPISILESAEIEIRKAPFLAITSVETLDESNVATAWASTNYYAASEHGFGRLVKKRGASWPTVQRDAAGIVVTFTAGYGAGASSVPMALRQAIKDVVLHWYENREAAAAEGFNVTPLKTQALLNQFRVGR